MEPITLKEAESFDFPSYKAEQEVIRNAKIDEVVKAINKIISINIEKIKLGPVSIIMPPLYDYDIMDDACKLFKDFTVSYSHWSPSVSVKLSKDEWNWPEQKPVVKAIKRRTLFQKLFS